MVDVLCDCGADVELLSNSGRTILFIVGRAYRTEVLERLVSRGAGITKEEVNVLTKAVRDELEFRKDKLGGVEQDLRIVVLENMLSWCRSVPSRRLS